MTVHALRPERFPWFRYEGYSFSLGLAEDGRAWLSGHSASEYDPEQQRIVVRGGMAEQVRTAFGKIAAVLEAAGLSLADVTRMTENVTLAGLDHYAEAAATRRELFGSHEPAIQTVVVDRLLREQALIEIEVHAARGGGTALSGGLREVPDGEVALPTVLPVDEGGDVVHEGDFVGQYAWCLDRADQLLRAVGLSLADTVTTYDFSTPATREVYRRTHAVRKERLGAKGVLPGAGGILMSRLHRPEVLVALDVTASRLPLKQVNPGWERYETLTYMPGVLAGRTLYMSGFAALDLETQEALHPGDVVAQAEATYGSVLEVLRAAGGGPEHLIGTIEFVCPEGLPAYRGVAKVRQELLREPWPASTGAVCAALLRPEFLIEVFPTALLPVEVAGAAD